MTHYSTVLKTECVFQIVDVGMNRDGYHYVLGTLVSYLWGEFTYKH